MTKVPCVDLGLRWFHLFWLITPLIMTVWACADCVWLACPSFLLLTLFHLLTGAFSFSRNSHFIVQQLYFIWDGCIKYWVYIYWIQPIVFNYHELLLLLIWRLFGFQVLLLPNKLETQHYDTLKKMSLTCDLSWGLISHLCVLSLTHG